MDTLEALRRQYRIDGVLDFARNAAGAAIAVVTTPAATAEVALAGAQVLGWQPAGQAPVIWLSPAARFVEGKAPRSVIVIRVDAVYFQCARAIVRSELWNPERHVDPASLPSVGRILADLSEGRVGGPAYDAEWQGRAEKTMW